MLPKLKQIKKRLKYSVVKEDNNSIPKKCELINSKLSSDLKINHLILDNSFIYEIKRDNKNELDENTYVQSKTMEIKNIKQKK